MAICSGSGIHLTQFVILSAICRKTDPKNIKSENVYGVGKISVVNITGQRILLRKAQLRLSLTIQVEMDRFL